MSSNPNYPRNSLSYSNTSLISMSPVREVAVSPPSPTYAFVHHMRCFLASRLFLFQMSLPPDSGKAQCHRSGQVRVLLTVGVTFLIKCKSWRLQASVILFFSIQYAHFHLMSMSCMVGTADLFQWIFPLRSHSFTSSLLFNPCTQVIPLEGSIPS